MSPDDSAPQEVIEVDSAIQFTIFDSSTGESVLTGTCPESSFASLASEGCVTVEGHYAADTHYWLEGEVRAYSESEGAAKAARPRYALRWENQTMTWMMPPAGANLEAWKSEKWAEIKVARETAEFGAFSVGDRMFDGDPQSQARIQGAIQLAQIAVAQGAPFSIGWTLADNTVVELTAPEIVEVGVALATRIQAVYATSRALRAQLAGAATVEEIAAVVWPSEAIG